jgi:hypothetical protein
MMEQVMSFVSEEEEEESNQQIAQYTGNGGFLSP